MEEFGEFEGPGDVRSFAGGLDEDDKFSVDGLFASLNGLGCEVVIEGIEEGLDVEDRTLDSDWKV